MDKAASLFLARFMLEFDDILNNEDGRIAFFYEEEPYIYNMVYAPLILKQATNGEVK